MMSGESQSLWARTVSKPPSYQRLPEDFNAQTYPSTLASAKLSRWKLFLTGFLLAAIIVSAGACIIVTSIKSAKSETIDTLTCGTTNEEALVRGCIMEPMVYGWMPEPCYFPELSSQYAPFEDRDWYTSREYLEEEKILPTDIWAGKYKNIFTRQYHGEHCLFLWRKLAMAVERRSEWLDHKTLNVDHVNHCSMVLEDHGIEWNNSSNDVVLGFYECRRMRWG
jgi:hypothetical protein